MLNTFQSTHPHGVRLTYQTHNCKKLKFQSTHPHGVRLKNKITMKQSLSFNPRTHTGCDWRVRPVYIGTPMFQSTHPHGVRLAAVELSVSIFIVSIHAPTRGATGATDYERHEICVSIHAPTRGATSSLYYRPSKYKCFNPRTHTGCDEVEKFISLRVKRFQSTHPHGVRHKILIIGPRKNQFQSTHPHGVRLDQLVAQGELTKVSIHAPTRGATVYSANV